VNPFGLSGLLTVLTSVGIGVFVLWKDSSSKLHRIWFAFTLSVAVWGVGVLLISGEDDPDAALLTWRISYAFGVLWIPILFYHFVIIFCELQKRRSLIVCYVVGALLFPWILFSPLFFRNARFVFSSFYYGMGGGLYLPYFIGWSSLVVHAHYLVYTNYRVASDTKRNQFKYILIAFVLAYGAGSLAYLPNFGVDVYPYGTFGILFYPLIVGYAIGAHHLMDIETALHKTIGWVATSFLFLIPALFLLRMAEPWLRQQHPAYLYGFICLLLVATIVYTRTLQPRVDQLFQRRQHHAMAVLRGLLQDHVALRSLSDIAANIEKTMRRIFYVSRVLLWVWDDPVKRFRLVGAEAMVGERVMDGLIQDHGPALVWMRRNHRIAYLDGIARDPEYAHVREVAQDCFRVLDAELMVPFIQEGRIIAILILGKKADARPFSPRDIVLLSTLQGEMTIAVGNAISYDQVQRLADDLRTAAAELEQRVVVRTQELQESKQSLETAYETLKAYQQWQEGFFADVNHEMRTPLTLILAATEMVSSRKEGASEPSPHIPQIQNLRTQSQRLLNLTNNLLYIAKLDAGKVEIYYRQDNFVRWAEGIVSSFLPVAAQKSLFLVFESPDELPEALFFDAEKMERVLSNLVMNALKFTSVGGVTVSCRRGGEEILVSVSDTGVGIPEEKLPRLFGRFANIGSATERRYQGTGIGLSMVSEMVRHHGGTLRVRSQVGQGTVFEFTLPLLTHVKNMIVRMDRRTLDMPIPDKNERRATHLQPQEVISHRQIQFRGHPT
jgi:signal transduction histidine kinase